jgi:hypothetical protein
MLERAKEATRYGKYTSVEYASFADDLVILIDAHPRHDRLMGAVEKRLREELGKLQVEINEEKINEEKSRNVDLGFLGSTSTAFAAVVACGVRDTDPSSSWAQASSSVSTPCHWLRTRVLIGRKRLNALGEALDEIFGKRAKAK